MLLIPQMRCVENTSALRTLYILCCYRLHPLLPFRGNGDKVAVIPCGRGSMIAFLTVVVFQYITSSTTKSCRKLSEKLRMRTDWGRGRTGWGQVRWDTDKILSPCVTRLISGWFPYHKWSPIQAPTKPNVE